MQCGLQCDQTSAFNCRSFTFVSSSSTCLLSGEDTASAGLAALAGRPGTDYYQRGPCLERKSDCLTVNIIGDSSACTTLMSSLLHSAPHRDIAAPPTPETDTSDTTDRVTGGQPGHCRFVQHNPHLYLSLLVLELPNISALLTRKNFLCINNLLEEKIFGLLCFVCMNRRHGPGVQGVLI